MPIEIRRFGVGHRRPDGPAGSVGLSGQAIYSDARGNVSELAFTRGSAVDRDRALELMQPRWHGIDTGGQGALHETHDAAIGEQAGGGELLQ